MALDKMSGQIELTELDQNTILCKLINLPMVHTPYLGALLCLSVRAYAICKLLLQFDYEVMIFGTLVLI